MVASLLWKEYREHRAVWVAMAAVAVGATLGVPAVFPPEPSQARAYNEILTVTAVILAWTYAIVCGAMLLAGERESGTQAFLDLMPAGRFRVWLVKLAAGLALVSAQLAVLAACVVIGQTVPPDQLHWFFLTLVLTGLLGLGWGLAFSARAATALAAIGQAIAAQFVLPPVAFFLVAIPAIILLHTLLHTVGAQTPREPPFLPLIALPMLVLPWPISARIYSREDRARVLTPAARRGRLAQPSREWAAVWSLAWSRTGGFVLGLGLFCFAAGFPLAAAGLVLWPLLTLLVGVVCGATVFLDEQAGPYRFLGDQRFPLARLWLLKAAARGFVGLCSLALMLLPSFVVMLIELGQHPMDHHREVLIAGRLFGSGLVGVTIPTALFLFAPYLSGFAVGHLCGVVFRKPIVALITGFGLAALLLSVWVPSFLTGGLLAWQVLSVPAVLVAAAFLLLRPWAGDRLASWDALSLLGGAAVVSAALVTAGLWYRAAEVPDEGEPPGLVEFVASIPSPEENEAGRAVRSALAQIESRRQWWEARRPARPPAPVAAPPDRMLLHTQCFEVNTTGWPADPARGQGLAEMLDEAFRDDCWALLDEAARKPDGMADDPRLRTVDKPWRESEAAGAAGSLLAARGLQQQAKGDPGVFLDNLDRALAMVRNLQNGGVDFVVLTARRVEAEQMVALDRWLEALDGHPDLLRRAGAALDRHLAWLPPTYHANELASYLIGLNSLDQPQGWVESNIPHLPKRGLQLSNAELLSGAWRAPWERERQRRLFRAAFTGDLRPFPHERIDSMRGTIPLGFIRPGMLRNGHPRRVALLHAARLKVALRHHQAVTGRPAERLDELIPGSVAAVPADPFDSRPFRYRLSKGEEIGWPQKPDPNADPVAGGEGGPGGGPGEFPAPPPLPGKKIPAGQGILWSVGEDHQDDGGLRQGLRPDQHNPTPIGEDLIYLVPLPRKKARE
jgi:hypothetical protein